MSETPEASPDDLLPFVKVTKADLPDSSKSILRLADKSWWLTKQTWMFKPEEMRDLEFEPAIPVFAEKLETKYGYYAAASLTPFGADAVSALLTAFQNTNPTVRVKAAAAIHEQGAFPIQDTRLTEASVALLKDSEPEVRVVAVEVLTDFPNWNPKFAEPLVALLRDQNPTVCHAVVFGLGKHRNDVEKYIPAIREMLKDKDFNVRASGMKMLWHLQVLMSRAELLQFFNVPDREVIGIMLSQFRKADSRGGNLKYDISDEEAVPLLQNSEPLARMIGLNILYHNAERQSVELALPLLKDPLVRRRTAATLRALTGQHFTEDQPDQWEKWWTEHKTNFVVELHPEELRPQRRGTNDFRWYLTNRPPASVP